MTKRNQDAVQVDVADGPSPERSFTREDYLKAGEVLLRGCATLAPCRPGQELQLAVILDEAFHLAFTSYCETNNVGAGLMADIALTALQLLEQGGVADSAGSS